MAKRQFFSRDKDFYRTLLRLTATIAMQNVIVSGVNLADNIMLGGYSESALSGVALANQVQFMLQMVVFGVGEGLVVIGSQYWGKRDTASIKKLLNVTLLFTLAITTAFLLVVRLFPKFTLSLYTNEAEVIAEGAKYIKIVCFSYIFFGLTQTLLSGMKTVETVRLGLVLSIVTLFVNIALNYCLIYGHFGFPRMGAAGAALATLFARILETTIVIVYYLCIDKKLQMKVRDFFGWSSIMCHDYVKVATPVVASGTIWGIAMSFQASILGHLGATTIAANSIAGNIFGIVSVAAYGCSAASGIFMGKTIGKGTPLPQIKEYVRSMQIIYIGIGLLSGSILFLLKDAIIALFSVTPDAIELARKFTIVLSVTLVGTAYQVACLTGIVRGGGDTKFVLINDSIFMWAIVLPFSYLAAFKFGWPPVAVFFCLKSDQILKCFVAIFKVNSYNWVRILTREQNP